MQKLLCALFVVLIFSCHMTNNNPDLIGKTEPSVLQKEPYKSTWYDKSYNVYTVNQDVILQTDSIKIDVFFGTWCEDCHKWLPRFIKTAEHHSLYYELYGLNTKKSSEKGYEKDKNIKRVPTFIVYKDGKEIGRIIESPVVSLEDDLYKIINNKPYTPNFAD